MAFDPALGDTISRIRFALGDTGTTSLLVPGGETTYAALLTESGGDATAAMRSAAGALATYYAAQPDRLTDVLGESIAWTERVAQWNRIASGDINPLPPVPGLTGVRGPQIGIIIAGSGWRPR